MQSSGEEISAGKLSSPQLVFWVVRKSEALWAISGMLERKYFLSWVKSR